MRLLIATMMLIIRLNSIPSPLALFVVIIVIIEGTSYRKNNNYDNCKYYHCYYEADKHFLSRSELIFCSSMKLNHRLSSIFLCLRYMTSNIVYCFLLRINQCRHLVEHL
mmetsp:Transcript_17005/g.23809  ORF Transcript_17005/g.23809 Transcript_17005/m.23809 type:complete len:109 (-) Transcript_17005:775-1101(-)